MYELYALFPFEQVEKDSRVIIYGAGIAGLNFVRQAGGSGYCKIICMVDSDSSKHNNTIFGLEKLLDLDSYDYVVVSPINFAIRKRIGEDLIALGVPSPKVIIPNDNNLLYWSLGGMLQHNIDGVGVREYDAVEIAAKSLVSAERLDIGIKWLLMRDIMNHQENPSIRSLYARHIYAWTQGREGFMPTSGKIKDGINEYIDSAKKLIEEISENKCNPEYAVPISADNEPLDGVHRIAACIEADIPLWVRKRPGLKPDIKPYTWYLENGFTTSDMQRIYHAFCDLYQGQYGILVLFSPAKDLWNFMLKQLEHKFQVVGYVDIELESNYIAFENLINDMYFYKWAYGSKQILDKINMLKLSELKIRVVIISDKKCNGENLYEQLREFKLALRESTYFDLGNIELQFHSSDNEAEARHLCRVLLSPNNLKYVQHRFKPSYRKDFIDALINLKKTLIERNVPIENICIINSSSMEVMGIRESCDVDFICLEENKNALFDLYPLSQATAKTAGIHELSIDYYTAEKARQYILDDNYHFIFFGFKFLNLELVREKKMAHNREKDKKDLRLLDLYDEMVMVYDKDSALKKGIYEETVKRRLHRIDQ